MKLGEVVTGASEQFRKEILKILQFYPQSGKQGAGRANWVRSKKSYISDEDW